jgi:hypothetical protein
MSPSVSRMPWSHSSPWYPHSLDPVHVYHVDAAIHAVALTTLTRVVAHDNDALADAEGYEAHGEGAKSVGHSASLKDT